MQTKYVLPAGFAAACLALAGPGALAQSLTVPDSRAAMAQAARVAADAVVDPAVVVPAVLYRSVFVDTPVGVESDEVDWRQANDDVGQFRRGHVDILKWESMHGEKH